MNGFEELCKTVHRAFEYGFHCNDMTMGEVEEDISFALNKFARENNLPKHDFESDYNDLYPQEETAED